MPAETFVVEMLDDPELARLGSVHPIRQANTAIHRDTAVATADLKVRNGESITQSLYIAIRKDNSICGRWRTLPQHQTNAVEFPGAPSFAPLVHAKGGDLDAPPPPNPTNYNPEIISSSNYYTCPSTILSYSCFLVSRVVR